MFNNNTTSLPLKFKLSDSIFALFRNTVSDNACAITNVLCAAIVPDNLIKNGAEKIDPFTVPLI